MKHLDYRTRIILISLTIYTLVFSLIIFFTVQAVWYMSLNKEKQNMEELASNVQLLVDQQTTELDRPAAQWFNQNAIGLSDTIKDYTTGTVYLFSKNQILLTNSPVNSVPETFMRAQVIEASEGNRVYSIRSINGTRSIQMVMPVMKDNEIIGYFGENYSLEQVASLTSYLLVIMILFGIAGLFLLAFLISRYASKFIQPIRELTRISQEIDHGNYNMVVQYKYDDEIGDLTRVYNQMTQNINSVIKQLEGERERLGSVLASLDDGLLALDGDGNVIASNSYLKTYFGVSNPKTIYDFTYQSFLRDIFDSLRNEQNYISEEVECNDRVLLLTGSPIHRSDLEENYMIIIRNITQTRHIEREQQKFISSVSHELRTPLTTIIGYTDMLMRRNVDDPKLLSSSLTTINREGHRLVRLVDDLLSVNSLDSLEFSVRRTTISLDALLHDVVDQMRIKGWQKEIEISYKSEPNIPNILGDYDRLSQAFINILHNAIKYSDKGGIIDVILTIENQYIAATIRDYGTGIDQAQQKLIFSAFYRIEEDRARNQGEGGAGLGLYLVKQIAEKHHGKIRIDSQIGEGTNVTLLLPIDTENLDQEENK